MPRIRSYIATIFILLIGSFLLISPSFKFSTQTSSRVVIDNMYKGIEEVRTLRFTLRKKERVDGVVLSGEQNCKFQRNPKKIYSKIISPNKGVELLYVEGTNGNKVLLNPNGFPYMNLTLDTYAPPFEIITIIQYMKWDLIISTVLSNLWQDSRVLHLITISSIPGIQW